MATASIRIDKDLFNKAEVMAKEFSRTPPKQIEHWAKIGQIMEGNPDLSYEFVKGVMISKAEKDEGLLSDYEFSDD